MQHNNRPNVGLSGVQKTKPLPTSTYQQTVAARRVGAVHVLSEGAA
jgi:hypothetical protein